MIFGHLVMLGALMMPCDTPAESNNCTNDRKIEIPINFDAKQRDKIREMIQFVSRDGKRWEQFAVLKSNQESVLYTAPEDGTYYFQMVIVYNDGKRVPEDPTKPEVAAKALKVIVDTKAPVITITKAEKVGDDITVSWEIVEDNPDANKFALEYKGADGTWNAIEGIKPLLVSSALFKLPTDEKLWVRVRIADLAGNAPAEAVKEVAGSGKALVVGTAISRTSNSEIKPPIDLIPNNTVAGSSAPALTLPANEGPTLRDLGPPVTPVEAVPIKPLVEPNRNDYSPVSPAAPANLTPSAMNPVATSGPAPVAPTGAPLPAPQVVNVSKFDLGYEVQGQGASGLSRAELWVTRDEGKTWLRWAISDNVDGKFPVDLTKVENRANPTVEGIYGFKIVLASGAGLTKGAPMAGEVPEIRVDVDVTPPVLKLFEPLPDPNQRNTIIIKWHAIDRNMGTDPITVEWAETADGPWYAVNGDKSGEESTSGSIAIEKARRLPNNGSYAWKLPANFPHSKVYLRICARDTAGNIAEVKTKEAVLIDMSRPVARIQGIVGTSGAEK